MFFSFFFSKSYPKLGDETFKNPYCLQVWGAFQNSRPFRNLVYVMTTHDEGPEARRVGGLST